MFVTLIAIVCHLAAAGPGNTDVNLCQEVVIATSEEAPSLTMNLCMAGAGQMGVAEWKTGHPVYSSDRYTIESYKCMPGHYMLRDAT
jgi:hypothetical protein